MAIFGAGYGFETLGRTHWLAHCCLHYWGDIDTHGFAILDALRSRFGNVESLLMDRKHFPRVPVADGARKTRRSTGTSDALTADERTRCTTTSAKTAWAGTCVWSRSGSDSAGLKDALSRL